MSFITVPVLVSQFKSIPTPSGGNTAVGVLSLSENLTGYENSAFGENALRINSTGFRNVAIGANALELNQDGDNNVGIGRSSLRINTSGNDNVAIGTSALISNVASANTAIGHAAANALQSGAFNVAVGYLSGAGNISGSGNTAIGVDSLSAATGSNNTALGYKSGELITTGENNTIVGRYNGNQGGLDIRTASNYVVLSDGNGNPRLYIDGAGLVTAPGGFSGGGGGGALTFNNQTAAYTVVSGDLGKIVNCTANTFTVSLTAAATLGAGFNCWVWNTGTGDITVDPSGAETIDGVSTLVLRRGEGLQIVCNGTNWDTGDKKTMRNYAENGINTDLRPIASATRAIAIGASTSATNQGAVSIGFGTTSSGVFSLAAAQGVAAADRSVAIGQSLLGGGAQTATNDGAIAFGAARSSGDQSFSAVITNNTSSFGATGARAVAIGQNSRASSNDALALAQGIASNPFAVAIGGVASANSSATFSPNGSASATAPNAFAFGRGALSAVIGKLAYGYVSTAQTGKLPLNRNTSNATPTVLSTDNQTASIQNQMILPNESAYAFEGTIVARQQASGGTQSAAWKIEGLIRREANAATTTLVASTVTVISNAPGWTLALSADTTNGGLAITATGAVGTNIRWSGNIDTSEVTFT